MILLTKFRLIPMHTSANNIDTSEEFLITHCNNGVKIIKPDSDNDLDSHLTIKRILHSPWNTYFVSANQVVQNLNETLANCLRYDSSKQIIGKTYYDLQHPDKKSMRVAANNNQRIMNLAKADMMAEECVLFDGSELEFINIKMPWYNDNNQIIGIFGCSMQFARKNIANSLQEMIKLFLPNFSCSVNKLFLNKKDDIIFTPREYSCLQLVIKGKTAKEIAAILNLSPRTIEDYFVRIKHKMNVRTKSQLIEKAIDYLK